MFILATCKREKAEVAHKLLSSSLSQPTEWSSSLVKVKLNLRF